VIPEIIPCVAALVVLFEVLLKLGERRADVDCVEFLIFGPHGRINHSDGGHYRYRMLWLEYIYCYLGRVARVPANV
jgi:hypothetical protein